MSISDIDPGIDPKLTAALDLVGRTGAESFQVRFSDADQPVIWMAVASYDDGKKHEVAAALTPLRSVLRLLEQLIDGGQCAHCKRPAGLEPDSIDTMPLGQHICWYQYDPELATFRRGCAGS